MSFDWQHWAGVVNTTEDDYWGEPVRLIPWVKGSYTAGGPDSSRAIRSTRGIYIEGDPQSAGAGARKLAVGEYGLSINSDDFIGFKQGDRVEFTERDITFEVSLEDSDPFGRSLVRLIRAIL